MCHVARERSRDPARGRGPVRQAAWLVDSGNPSEGEASLRAPGLDPSLELGDLRQVPPTSKLKVNLVYTGALPAPFFPYCTRQQI